MMPGLFFTIALLYALAGFGGGSSYTALLVLFDVPYTQIPLISLCCNLIVVTGGCWYFIQRKHFDIKLLWPFALGSIPMAYLGGSIPISKDLFLGLLGLSLFCAGLRLIWQAQPEETDANEYSQPHWLIALVIGMALGFLSGLVGIGGGIFLAPLMLNLRWGAPKQVAASASAFIWLNSIAGLLGQLTKHGALMELSSFWPLFVAVLVGGQIGSHFASGPLPSRWLSLTTAALVLFVGGRLLFPYVQIYLH